MSDYTNLSDIIVDGVVESSAQGSMIGRVDTMPTASSKNEGCIVLYSGTTGTYTSGTFYKCVKSGASYSWQKVTITGTEEDTYTANRVLVSSSSGAPTASTITSTELGYLDGVTSSIQNQFSTVNSNVSTANSKISTLQGQMSTAQSDISAAESDIDSLEGSVSSLQSGKQNTITGGASTITTSNLTTGRALVSNTSGKVAVSTVTSTELGYLDGAKSSIQNQIDTLSSRITSMSGFTVQVVSSLPSSGSAGTMYFVPSSGGSGQNIYDEYLYVNGKWEQVGSTTFSLNISQTSSGITINGTALQDASASRDGLMTASRYSAITTLQNNMSTAQSDIDDLESTMSTTVSRVSTCEDDIDSLQTSVSSANSNISTLQGQMSTANGNISTLQGQISTLVPYSGGTMTGALIAQSNTNYTTAQVRNITISISEPSGGNNGDIWIVY